MGEPAAALVALVAARLSEGVRNGAEVPAAAVRAVVGSAPSVSDEERAPTAPADPIRFLESALRAIVFGAGAYALTVFDFLFRPRTFDAELLGPGAPPGARRPYLRPRAVAGASWPRALGAVLAVTLLLALAAGSLLAAAGARVG